MQASGRVGTSAPAVAPASIPRVSEETPTKPVRVLVYSDDSTSRASVVLALGKRPHPDLPEFEYVECATGPVVLQHLDKGGLDLVVLDGEAVPTGGMGIARQLKDEIFQCPPLLLLTGRPQDAWLATWSRVDAVVSHPVDPIVLASAVVSLVTQRLATAARS